MKKLGLGVAAAGMAMVAAAQSEAQADPVHPGYVQLGAVNVAPNPHQVQVYALGSTIPNASYNSPDQTALSVEAGWYVDKSWAASVSVASEVKSDMVGTGALAGTPALGSQSFMLISGTLTYHFNADGMISPYAGAGATFFHSSGTTDGAWTNTKVDDAWGGVAQIGVNLNINDRWGVFVDAKKHLLNIEGRGSMLGGLIPISTKTAFDPLVVGAGAVLRF